MNASRSFCKEYFSACTNSFFHLLFVSAAKIKIMSQQDRIEEFSMHDVTSKVDSEHDDDCVDEQVSSLETNKIYCVLEGYRVEDASFNNNSGVSEKDAEKRLRTGKGLSVTSSQILRGEKKLEPKMAIPEVGMHVVRKEVLSDSSKLSFRSLQLKGSLVVREETVSNIEATNTAAPAETSQPEDSISNSTRTKLQPYKPSENMTPVETLELLKDMVSSCNTGEKLPMVSSCNTGEKLPMVSSCNTGEKLPVIRLVTMPPGKVPISRLRSSVSSKGVSSKGQVQLLSVPSQCQEFLLSLAGSGRLQTSMPSVQENKQIPSAGGTQGIENTVGNTVTKITPDVRATSSVDVQQVVKSSAGEIQGTLVSAGKLAVRQGEQQSVNPDHMKVTVHAPDNPQVNPVPGSSFGQLPLVLPSPAAGDLQPLQIPLSSSSFGQIPTLQVPYVTGAPHSYLPVLLPPSEAVVPSVAGSSQMFQFQHVVPSSSGGQLNPVPSAGVPHQLHAVVGPAGNFIVVSSDTGQQFNFTSPSGNQF